MRRGNCQLICITEVDEWWEVVCNGLISDCSASSKVVHARERKMQEGGGASELAMACPKIFRSSQRVKTSLKKLRASDVREIAKSS